ncbi:hypothetical protein D1P53_001880 [Cryptococcus gattii VGV]|nr:hypothetical protein D1P53_001880 [Cryptococcus gattii VGV]
MPYTPAYPSSYSDPEKGLPASPSSLARHMLVPRKPRWILGGLFICGVVLYYMNSNKHEKTWGRGGSWDAQGDDSMVGWKPSDDKNEPLIYSDYTVDDQGNHFIKGWQQPITPMHPDVDLLPRAPSIFPYLNISESEQPEEKIFPDSDLRQIISEPPELPEEQSNSMPEGAWSQKWSGPEVWDQPRRGMKRVQWEGFAGGRDRWESENERKVREERKDAVKRGFKHAWEAYKRHAWGHDEIRPVSLTASDPFNGWGATIVDSLDTLLLMGFSNEYNLCRPHINQLNFHWVNGRDWSEGYVSEDLSGSGEVFALNRDKSVRLPVFETGIRYLGGLLGAYDLSGDDLLLERAIDLANVLSTAFKTGSGLPIGRVDPGTKDEMIKLGTVSVAEVGSMSLELIRLAQITKDRKWFDLAQRAMDYIRERVIPRGTHSPLIPMWFQPDAPLNTPMNGGLTFGGLADSYYEYLIKTYKLLGASEVSQVWRDVYERSIDKAKETLYVDIDIVPGRDILAIGKLENGRLIPELEHLTCFIGAMLGLGAKLLNRPGDMRDAERVTASCYWLSADTPTGLQPEVVEWYAPHETSVMYENVSISGGGKYHPLVYSEKDFKGRDGMHRDRNGVLRWNGDNEPVLFADREKKKNPETPIKYGQRLKGTPTGARKVSTRGINRPETIESIFYMYRITGDRKWQEKGWKMFTSWMNTSTVDGGFSSVEDVTVSPVRFSDNMESFALAETFKYHFLLQSEPDVLSLDDYVLNTEAHPLLTNPKLDPKAHTSHTRFWSPPSSQDLGVRAQGTNVQKYARLEVIERASSPFRPPPPQNAPGGGGGRGMGGGGGKPGVIPELPPEVLKNRIN